MSKGLLVRELSWERENHSFDVSITCLRATYRVDVEVTDDYGKAEFMTRYFQKLSKAEDFVDVLKVLERLPERDAEKQPQP